MERRMLGRTGIEVSRLCLGTLTMGPLQANIHPDAGAELICKAVEQGINFFDTAELYGTYEYLRKALRRVPREAIVISSRCYQYTYEGMRDSLERALREIGIDYIDIFGLHEQESRLTLKGHADAIRYLQDAKEKGLVRAVSVSTHAVEVVRAVSVMPEIDIVHPIFNKRGIGIMDGDVCDMERAIEAASLSGVGVYSMKPLGGGHLYREVPNALTWVMNHDYIDSVAIGIKNIRELEVDVAIASGRKIPEEVLSSLAGEKRLLIEMWCAKCGACIDACSHGALSMGADRVVVDPDKCVLCGYCVAHCREFCIKVV